MKEYKTHPQLGKLVSVALPPQGGQVDGVKAVIVGEDPAYSGRVVAVAGDQLIVAPRDTVLYEPELRERLGLPDGQELLCLYEKTCGAVLYTYVNRERHYLLLKTDSGHIGFPKGHIERGETEEQTALREVWEETGFQVTLDKSFRRQYEFVTLENTKKKCVYFLAEYEYAPAKIQEEEILQSWLVPYQEAVRLLNFVQDKEILAEAERRLAT